MSEKKTPSAQRKTRLAVALKANLARRKAQARAAKPAPKPPAK
jgi:hypothetical protein